MVDKVLNDPKVEKVSFVHCVKDENCTPFLDYLSDIQAKNPKFKFQLWNTEKNGLISTENIKDLQSKTNVSDVYCVGPEGLMALVKNNILEQNRFKYEFFGPLVAI